MNLSLGSARRPWFVYASSREVYGQHTVFPVQETAALMPMNTYARSKLAAEELVLQAQEAGLRTALVRFSSVYGDVDDHIDRVVPAFASAAAHGGTIRIDGPECTFDFTHVSDVAAGVLKLCEVLSSLGENKLPPVHFVSGVPTTLGALAEMATAGAVRRVDIREAPHRTFDVSRFWGDPKRAIDILGWRATTPLREGFHRLITDFALRADRANLQIGPAATPM